MPDGAGARRDTAQANCAIRRAGPPRAAGCGKGHRSAEVARERGPGVIGDQMPADREPNPLDSPNPFERPSPWPRPPQAPMRIGPLPKAGPPAAAPAPAPRFEPERPVNPRTSIFTGSAIPLRRPDLAIPDPPGSAPREPEADDAQPALAIPDTPGALPRSWPAATRRKARPARLAPALAAGAVVIAAAGGLYGLMTLGRQAAPIAAAPAPLAGPPPETRPPAAHVPTAPTGGPPPTLAAATRPTPAPRFARSTASAAPDERLAAIALPVAAAPAEPAPVTLDVPPPPPPPARAPRPADPDAPIATQRPE